MDRSVKFNLIADELEQDAIGQYVRTGVVSREVYGQLGSITRDEFFSAGRNGFKPSLMVSMFAPDYEGEQTCTIDGVTYSIYRTYRRRNDLIELYLERRVGDG